MIGAEGASVGNRVRAYQADGDVAFPGNSKLKPQDEEIRKLKEENHKLKWSENF